VTTARLRASRPHQILQALALLWISTTLGFFSSLSENDESWETVLLAALVMLALTVVLSVGPRQVPRAGAADAAPLSESTDMRAPVPQPPQKVSPSSFQNAQRWHGAPSLPPQLRQKCR